MSYNVEDLFKTFNVIPNISEPIWGQGQDDPILKQQ